MLEASQGRDRRIHADHVADLLRPGTSGVDHGACLQERAVGERNAADQSLVDRNRRHLGRDRSCQQ